MSNSPTGHSAGPFPKLEKLNSGGFVPGAGTPLAAMLPLIGEHILPRAIPRSAYMDAMPPHLHFTLRDRFTAPFVHIALHCLNRIVPAIDRRINARQRRRIRRMLQRDLESAATRILETGRP